MARYGQDRYGISYYGVQTLVAYDASPFTAVSRASGSLLLRWTTPSGSYDTTRVVRSAYGNPIDETDGQVVLQTTDRPTELADAGLTEGAWYYYSLFVREPIGLGFVWRRAGDTAGLVSTDHNYSELLLQRLPAVFTTNPAEMGGQADSGSLLGRFLSIFGFELDAVRTSLASLRRTKDPDAVAGRLLPLLAQQIGQVYEPEIGMAQNRVLLRNTIYLYKTKGTRPCIEGLATSITGWAARVVPAVNLLLAPDAATPGTSTGGWAVTAGAATVLARPSDASTVVGGLRGYSSAATGIADAALFQVTSTADGRVELSLGGGGLSGVPVPAGPVTLSVFLRSAATVRTPQLALRWFGALGAPLGATAFTGSASTTTTGWDLRATLTATPPAGAYFAQPVLAWPTTAANEVQYFDAAQLEVGSVAGPFAHARDVRVALLPDRRNVVPNPGIEVDTTGWAHDSGGTVSRATDFTHAGQYGASQGSLLVSAGSSASSGKAGIAVPTMPATTYAVSVWVYGPAGTYSLALGAGTVSGAVPSNAWTRLFLTRTTDPADAAGERLVVTGPAGVAFHLDDALVEIGSTPGSYFDGGTSPGETGWEGTPGNSASDLFRQRPLRDDALRRNLPRYLPMGSAFTISYPDGYSPV